MRIGWLAAVGAVAVICAPQAEARRLKSTKLRTVSFNIRYDFRNDGPNRWANRVDAVAKRIKDSKAHIVCLQEDKKHQIDDLKERLKKYAFLGRGRNATGSGERCSILYLKSKIRVKKHGEFWLSDTPDVAGSNTWRDKYPRKVTWAMLETKQGKKQLLVLNTHLPEGRSNPLRPRGVQVMVDWVQQKLGIKKKTSTQKAGNRKRGKWRKGGYKRGGYKRRGRGRSKDRSVKASSKLKKLAILVTGDFNDPAGESRTFEILTQGLGLRDAWKEGRTSDPSPGTYAGWRGMRTQQRIDWILVGGRVKVARAGKYDKKVKGRWPSDHYAIFADIEVY